MFRTLRANGRALVLSSIILGLLITPFALASGEGSFIKGGKRNPSSNASSAYRSETQLIADNATYGTRQSNKGDGGGAIYGCRSAPGAEPCMRGANLEQGRAFEFSTKGAEAGFIEASGGDTARPFATNATGVATGLNADRVDSKSADEIAGDGAKAAVSTVQAATRFASVDADGTLLAGRGVTSAATGAAGDGTYTALFTDDISSCAFSATETQFENAGAVGIGIGADKKTVTVRTRSGGGADGTDPTAPTDRPFHLVANCL